MRVIPIAISCVYVTGHRVLVWRGAGVGEVGGGLDAGGDDWRTLHGGMSAISALMRLSESYLDFMFRVNESAAPSLSLITIGSSTPDPGPSSTTSTFTIFGERARTGGGLSRFRLFVTEGVRGMIPIVLKSSPGLTSTNLM